MSDKTDPTPGPNYMICKWCREVWPEGSEIHASCPGSKNGTHYFIPFEPAQDVQRKRAPIVDDSVLPSDDDVRKDIPLARGLLDYFPAALAAVAEVSRIGNEQHNPGQEIHWSRHKSTEHADSLLRHLVDRGKLDSDGQRHSAKVAWRALAILQEELEEQEGVAPGRASKFSRDEGGESDDG